MKNFIVKAAFLTYLFCITPAIADTIDRIWFEDDPATLLGDYIPGSSFYLPTIAELYFADNNMVWNSGAGAQRSSRVTFDSLTSNSNTIQYNLVPPLDGILYTSTDYGTNVGSPCTEGTLGIVGPMFLEAESGARIAFFRGNTQILVNEIDECDAIDYYPYSANAGDTIPYEFMLILDNGNTWNSTVFNNRWRYRILGHFDFASISLHADAGPDLNAWSCKDVILDGSGSADSNQIITDYKWELLHRTDNTQDLIVYGISPTISNLTLGTYDVILTVTNDIGFKDADTMVLTVSSDCPPTIVDVRIFKDGAPPVESYVYNIDDMSFFEITVEDPDLDIVRLILEEYYPSNSATPYWGPYVFNLPPQPSSPAYIYTDPAPVTGPEGEWRLVFKLEDAAGNVSEEFEVFATVESAVTVGSAGAQGSNGGGGGGGGCFISTFFE